MNMPDLKEARKRTKEKVNILYQEYKLPDDFKTIVNMLFLHMVVK